jgi:hypothetical protein
MTLLGAQKEPAVHQVVSGTRESESFALFGVKLGGFVSVGGRTLFESENGPRTAGNVNLRNRERKSKAPRTGIPRAYVNQNTAFQER